MKDLEKEYLASYRKLNWTLLITWIVIAIISIFFAYFLGYAWGEWVYPILADLDFHGWAGLFIIVVGSFILTVLYHKIKKSDDELWGD